MNTITLPEDLMTFAQEQALHAGFSTPDEYVQSLVAADQQRKAAERLEALLLEGLDSGDAVEVTPAFWERLRNRIQQNQAKAGDQ